MYGPLLREQSLRSLPFLCFDLSSGSEGDGNADLDASYPMIKKRVSLERQLLEKVPLKMGFCWGIGSLSASTDAFAKRLWFGLFN